MNFADQMALVDEVVFDQLSDDTAALWTPRGGQPLGPVRVIVDDVERPAVIAGMNQVQMAHAVRVLATELERLALGIEPGEGDAFTVNGEVLVVRGKPWRDGGDWICAVSG